MTEATFILDEPGKNIPPADLALARRVAEHLHKHYPGWLWLVHADHHQGIVTIRCGETSAYDLNGYLLHIKKMTPGLQEVMLAGGEILERYQQHRGRMPDSVGQKGYVTERADG